MSDKNGTARDTIIQPGVPVRFEWRNFRRQYRERSIGALHLIQIEISAEDWAALATMPRDADGEIVMWVTEVGGVKEENPRREKKPKVKTPFGDLWQELLHRNRGFEHIPGVKEALEELRGAGYEQPHELMRKVFGVESLSHAIGPAEIYAKFPYPQVKTMVEQALRQVEAQEARKTQ